MHDVLLERMEQCKEASYILQNPISLTILAGALLYETACFTLSLVAELNKTVIISKIVVVFMSRFVLGKKKQCLLPRPSYGGISWELVPDTCWQTSRWLPSGRTSLVSMHFRFHTALAAAGYEQKQSTRRSCKYYIRRRFSSYEYAVFLSFSCGLSHFSST